MMEPSYHAKYQKERYDLRRAAGQCIRCGKPSVTVNCEDCRQRVRDYRKATGEVKYSHVGRPRTVLRDEDLVDLSKVIAAIVPAPARQALPEGIELNRPVEIVCMCAGGRMLSIQTREPEVAKNLWAKAKADCIAGLYASVSIAQGMKVFLKLKRRQRPPAPPETTHQEAA